MIANTLLARWSGGYVEIGDDSSVTTYGRREAPLEVGDLYDIPAVLQVASNTLDLVKQPTTSIIAAMDDTDADIGYSAYVDYDVGDTVTWPTISGGSAAVRCAAISISEEPDGYLNVTPEFDTAADVIEQRVNRWLSRTNGGALAGRSAQASRTSVSSPSVNDSTVVNPAEITFSTEGSYAVEVGDEAPPGKTPSISGFFYGIQLDCGTAGTTATSFQVRVNGTLVATATLAGSSITTFKSLTASETLKVTPSSIFKVTCSVSGGHVGVAVKCLISSIEI